ncbi:pyruvate dehydrogenase E2 component (dihydrolipoamide acetyltransferase) [Streptacidiphilus sp. MAP12-16]|uniref:dihydrolipoamide acetyltransferase family protein n=1 Tax=Streptacidiphilus sp. MAP12-16 TaxID=3156300 RepID=UPI00351781B4
MDVTMPQLGETVAEATLTRWLKRTGEQVAAGEPLFEVATDKVDTEIPAAADGTLSEILVTADQTVPVGTRLAVIETGAKPATSSPPTTAADRAGGKTGQGQLTPLVRRLLAEHELTSSQVVGTGPGGRITRDDVEAAAQLARPRPEPEIPPAPAAVPVPKPLPAPLPAPLTERLPDDAALVPFSTIRRRTAEHMVRSKATSPHTLMAVEVDFAGVDAVRRRAGGPWRAAEGFSLTYLPFVARAVVDALAAYPHLNASVGDQALIVHRRVHLGIAVDLDADGLVVPVIRDAAERRLRALAREISDRSGRARAHRLGADDLTGGTFTISNPGPYGTLLTAAIINQPQVAILATDAVRPRPVAVATADGEYAIAVHPVGNLALTFDHRAIDGGYAARFLREVKTSLETRDWSAEL